MGPELGSFAIILALSFALIQGIAGFFRSGESLRLSLSSAIIQFIFLSVAMLCLIASFLQQDMSVIYVREHSHALLPVLYRMGAAWGGHEGSLLLWCLILAGWTVAFILFADKKLSRVSRSNIVMILGFISSGFITFLLMTSNPFQRDFPTSLVAGNDLTPILQDPGLIFHPPMLYLGYVGFAIGFAFAISALIEGKFSAEWARACRPWIVLPWSFLSCGIVLGSWWAYRELGWGGWWFWDPVENASLLPWLSATALLHSLVVSEKRQSFKGWTLLLAIITFTLSLLGTFLVRSGVLVSVHAFANDPARGLFLLCYLAVIIGGAFLLYGFRIKDFYQAPQFELLSRETFLLLNSVILLAAVFTIVIGTLYPIILDAFGWGKISVGEPYFNLVFMPIIIPLLLLMGFAPHVHWKKQAAGLLAKKMGLSFFVSIIISIFVPVIFGFEFFWLTSLGIFLGVWIILATIQYAFSLKQLELKHAAMIVAHMGIAVIALGVTVNKSYSAERQIKIMPGESVSLAGYQFTFSNIDETRGANYNAVTATFDVQKNNSVPEKLIAEQRIYTAHQETLSKPGILVNPFRDLYLALGNGFADGGWAVRIYYKPMVRWIWAGGFLLLTGGLLSLLSHLKKRSDDE
ncbi:MAG TPA: heme lyase CcmF/NrfE family subunit [Gammaproteobacteria bacterium]|nr:heme lyase CcmF/NrfE family subunit [Gammaproteobacteria bacterium]